MKLAVVALLSNVTAKMMRPGGTGAGAGCAVVGAGVTAGLLVGAGVVMGLLGDAAVVDGGTGPGVDGGTGVDGGGT